jgi:kynurenine--oxoglutarate transaminase/cysteine-S-conjugate beta-lyase/glutamine--phenylpyruvate transaminase
MSCQTDELRDYRFVKWLAKKRNLLGIPPSAFFSSQHKHIGEDYIRFCFIKVLTNLQFLMHIFKL